MDKPSLSLVPLLWNGGFELGLGRGEVAGGPAATWWQGLRSFLACLSSVRLVMSYGFFELASQSHTDFILVQKTGLSVCELQFMALKTAVRHPKDDASTCTRHLSGFRQSPAQNPVQKQCPHLPVFPACSAANHLSSLCLLGQECRTVGEPALCMGKNLPFSFCPLQLRGSQLDGDVKEIAWHTVQPLLGKGYKKTDLHGQRV